MQQDLQELYRQRDELLSLQNHPGYIRVAELLEQQTRLRRIDAFGNRLDCMDKAFHVAFTQGEVAGLQFVRALVDILLADLDANIQTELQKEREEEKDGESSGN